MVSEHTKSHAMNTKRTLELSHDEIELLRKALSFAYLQTIEMAKSKLLSDDAKDRLIKCANEYVDLEYDIREGLNDV